MVKKTNEEDSMQIGFSVKELFQQLNASINDLRLETNRKLDGLTRDLSLKADQHHVDQLEARVNSLEKEAISSAAVQKCIDGLNIQAKTSRQQWWAILVSFLIFLATAAVLFQHK